MHTCSTFTNIYVSKSFSTKFPLRCCWLQVTTLIIYFKAIFFACLLPNSLQGLWQRMTAPDTFLKNSAAALRLVLRWTVGVERFLIKRQKLNVNIGTPWHPCYFRHCLGVETIGMSDGRETLGSHLHSTLLVQASLERSLTIQMSRVGRKFLNGKTLKSDNALFM